MTDLKTSLLVNKQVPEFVRAEYPLFITFLEAYYEYLENAQGTDKNDVIAKSKDLRYVSDVDSSISQFEENFFNMYASLFPRDVEVSKETLIKNVLPLCLARGNEKSFKLLFRMLFNDEVEVLLPKNNILRASDGKWVIDNILKLETDIRSVYTANGSNTTFYLAQQVDNDDVEVYVNDVLKIAGTDYFIRKESRKLIFNSAPSSNAQVKVVYSDFDIELLNNRKVTGLKSGATAIVESSTKKIITDRLNLGLPFELFINSKTLSGNFSNGEEVTTDIIDSNGTKITLTADTFSILTSITVINGGSSYNVGDPVLVLGGGAETPAIAEVETISSGFTNRIRVDYGGAGFKTASEFESEIPLTLIRGALDGIDTTGIYTNNFYVVTDELIENYASVLISSSDYGFPSSIIPTGENVNSRIYDSLTSTVVTDLGPITNAKILFSNTSINTSAINSEGAKFQLGNTFQDIKTFRSIGRIDVYSGGTGYKVGDEIIFGSNPVGTSGYGAAAAVLQVAANGAVERVQVQPQRIGGTANILNNTITITGTNTNFGVDVAVGDKIVIRSQERFINAITSATSATVNVPFSFTDTTTWANNYPIGSYSRGFVGGVNYTQGNFPTANVSNMSGGSGANVAITSLMGDGEILTALTDSIVGQIQSIKVLSGGTGYEYIPQIDLTNRGDGSAVANAVIGSSYQTFPGRWKTSDSILSSDERRLQGSNYYVDYSYVTSSLTEFTKYKTILRELLHPAGFVNYADYNKTTIIKPDAITVSSLTENVISGKVSVTNGSIYVTGTNTSFNISNSRGTLTIGTSIAVNGELRIVNSIISNTNISVSSAFTTNASAQTLIIVT